jgi:hypothetical protein
VVQSLLTVAGEMPKMSITVTELTKMASRRFAAAGGLADASEGASVEAWLVPRDLEINGLPSVACTHNVNCFAA